MATSRKRQEPNYTPSAAVLRNEAGAGYTPTGAYNRASRRKLAEILNVHISTVSQIFRGRHKPQFSMAIRIAKELGVTPEEFLKELSWWQGQFRAKVQAEKGKPLDKKVFQGWKDAVKRKAGSRRGRE